MLRKNLKSFRFNVGPKPKGFWSSREINEDIKLSPDQLSATINFYAKIEDNTLKIVAESIHEETEGQQYFSLQQLVAKARTRIPEPVDPETEFSMQMDNLLLFDGDIHGEKVGMESHAVAFSLPHDDYAAVAKLFRFMEQLSVCAKEKASDMLTYQHVQVSYHSIVARIKRFVVTSMINDDANEMETYCIKTPEPVVLYDLMAGYITSHDPDSLASTLEEKFICDMPGRPSILTWLTDDSDALRMKVMRTTEKMSDSDFYEEFKPFFPLLHRSLVRRLLEPVEGQFEPGCALFQALYQTQFEVLNDGRLSIRLASELESEMRRLGDLLELDVIKKPDTENQFVFMAAGSLKLYSLGLHLNRINYDKTHTLQASRVILPELDHSDFMKPMNGVERSIFNDGTWQAFCEKYPHLDYIVNDIFPSEFLEQGSFKQDVPMIADLIHTMEMILDNADSPDTLDSLLFVYWIAKHAGVLSVETNHMIKKLACDGKLDDTVIKMMIHKDEDGCYSPHIVMKVLTDGVPVSRYGYFFQNPQNEPLPTLAILYQMMRRELGIPDVEELDCHVRLGFDRFH